MGAQWTGGSALLTNVERVAQAQHDARHPGKVCQHCPVTVASNRAIEQRRAEFARREEWRMRRAAALVLVVLISCWLLGSWLLGPS